MKRLNPFSEWLLRFTASQKNIGRVAFWLGGTVSVLTLVLTVVVLVVLIFHGSMMMTRQHVVPEDFPREPTPGVVSGAQPKVLVREMDGQYRSGLTDEELWTRYDGCEDLAGQLAQYASGKMSASGLSLDNALERVEKGLRAKVTTGRWDFSPGEMAWLIKRTRELLLAAANDAGGGNASC